MEHPRFGYTSGDQLKILHLVQNYFPSVGGTQAVIQQLSEGLTSRYRDDVVVFTTNAMNNPQKRDNEFLPTGNEHINGVLVRRFGFWRRHRKLANTVSRYANRLGVPFRDYVELLSGAPMSPAMMIATLRARVDVVGCMAFPYLHMYYPLYLRPPPPRQPVVLFGALHLDDEHVARPILAATHRAQAYIAFTEFERQVLIRNGVTPDRVHVVGLGVDVKQFEGATGTSIRTRYEIGEAPLVGFIGRQVAYKGCDTLIKAMTRVWDRFPNAHLLLAGARTNFSQQLDSLIAQLPRSRQARVTITHDFSEEEKPHFFAACDVVVSVSSKESFGLVFVEAWAAGKPVIGGRIPAVECVIREGQDGLLVPCAEPEQLSDAIGSLLADKQLRLRLGRNGRDKVIEHHDWPIVVEKVHKIYERVASDWRG